MIWRGPLKMGVIQQFLADVAWGDLDYLVVDSPPGTGDEPLSLCQLVGSRRCGDRDDATGRGLVPVRKSIHFCGQLGMPVLGVVENMSGFVCPGLRPAIDVFGSGGGERMAADMGVPFLGRIPLDPAVSRPGTTAAPTRSRCPTRWLRAPSQQSSCRSSPSTRPGVESGAATAPAPLSRRQTRRHPCVLPSPWRKDACRRTLVIASVSPSSRSTSPRRRSSARRRCPRPSTSPGCCRSGSPSGVPPSSSRAAWRPGTGVVHGAADRGGGGCSRRYSRGTRAAYLAGTLTGRERLRPLRTGTRASYAAPDSFNCPRW